MNDIHARGRRPHLLPSLLNRSLRRQFTALTVLASLLVSTAAFSQSAQGADESPTKFRRVPTQFIAALGDPNATSGTGAENWGVWRVDPGPRGVWLRKFDELQAAGGIAPARWKFDQSNWWVDENGLIMESPDFPLPPGKYVVHGEREAVTILTIDPSDSSGSRSWRLDDGVKLYDVTHLPCRSAVYTPVSSGSCSPANAPLAEFPVEPGSIMPSIDGCKKQDYAVLFIVGIAVED